MIERCKYCGAALPANTVIIAYHGKLFCKERCCRRYVANDIMKHNVDISVNGGYEKAMKIASKRVSRESEQINSSDIGIESPACPFKKGACDSNCALSVNGSCAIALLAINK